MARNRRCGRRDWPPNLYTNRVGGRTYWVWRDPRTGRRTTLKTKELRMAKAAAIRLNARIAVPETVEATVAAAERDRRSFSDHCDWFLNTLLAERAEKDRLSKRTVAEYRRQLVRMEAEFGACDVASMSRQQIADWLEVQADHTATRCRSLLVQFFRSAHERGYRDDNPAELTRKRITKTRRQRLTQEDFDAALTLA